MFGSFKRRLQDVRTLAKLCTLAEEIARKRGRAQPGSEHFVLAALMLPDGTARHAFERLGLAEAAFVQALESQRADVLASVGVAATGSDASQPVPLPEHSKVYEADPSGQSLVQRLAEARGERSERGLMSADVLLAVSQETYTASARAFQRLDISTTTLSDAARRALTS
jgi:hypothetical protein